MQRILKTTFAKISTACGYGYITVTSILFVDEYSNVIKSEYKISKVLHCGFGDSASKSYGYTEIKHETLKKLKIFAKNTDRFGDVWSLST